MKKRIKLICTLVMGFIIFLMSVGQTFAVITVPSLLRVGLFYNSTALTSFSTSAPKGIRIGVVEGDTFISIFDEVLDTNVKVEKDSSFHVNLGIEYGTLEEATRDIVILKGMGIKAFTAHINGKWQTWMGSYPDESSANTSLLSFYEPKLGKAGYVVVAPANRIIASKSLDEVLLVVGNTASQASIQIRPAVLNNPYLLKLNTKQYRGDIEVRMTENGNMTVINILTFEQYLYGVVPSEIESNSHIEALKAQAVAARSYSMGNIGKHSKYNFDVCSTTDCQVYKGFDGEAASTNKAVDATQGKKITYNGKLASAFFFSSDGGKTEAVENVWGSTIPYLVSVEDKYESGKSYKYIWEETRTIQQVKQLMDGRGYKLGDILSINITERTPTGRALEMVVQGSTGSKVYKKEGCRTAFSLHSQWFNITTDSDVSVGETPQKMQIAGKKVASAGGITSLSSKTGSFKIVGAGDVKKSIPLVPTQFQFSGRGWGHGIGMSQEGAKGMALAGFSYEDILKHYYTGVVVE